MRRLAVASAVVAGWTAANAVLVIVLVAYGEAPMAIALYAGAVALLTAFAVVVWAHRGGAPPVRRKVPSRGAPAVAVAVTVALFGLALVYWFVLAFALAALVVTVVLTVYAWRGGGVR